MGTDHAFAELGLPSDATEREVKAAWRRLVSQWHPDRNDSASAVARMQRINQAFEHIRRARFRNATPDAEASDDSSGSTSAETTARTDAAEDDTQPQRPPIRRKVRLTLEEAAAGCIKVLRGRIANPCLDCAGAGYQVLGGNCAKCGGSGAVRKRTAWFGWPGASVECDACLGNGIARRTCRACSGSGRLQSHSYRVQVRIPHGVRDGDLLHVDARRARPSPPPAALEIVVTLLSHAFFELDEDGTIRCEMPVDGFAWIANRLIQVPTLSGLKPLQLSRDRLAYRLKNQGFPVERRGARGDQIVTLVPVFPEQLSTDQQILLDQLSATSSRADGRLRAWNQGLRTWERKLPRQGPPGS